MTGYMEILCKSFRLGFTAALITMTVWEQHPKSYHKGKTRMQTHQVVR